MSGEGHSAEKAAGLIEVYADLCNAGGTRDDSSGNPGGVGASFYRDDRREGTWAKHGIPGNYFTCAGKANGLNIFPCTGSEHRGPGVVVICTCACHTGPAQQIPQTPWNRPLPPEASTP